MATKKYLELQEFSDTDLMAELDQTEGQYQKLKFDPRWNAHPHLMVYNLYQHNKGTKGAAYRNANSIARLDQCRLKPPADQWNITDVDEPESSTIQDYFMKGLRFLESA